LCGLKIIQGHEKTGIEICEKLKRRLTTDRLALSCEEGLVPNYDISTANVGKYQEDDGNK